MDRRRDPPRLLQRPWGGSPAESPLRNPRKRQEGQINPASTTASRDERRDYTIVAVLRHESWQRPTGASPVRVSAAAPGSRPQSRGETPAAERGVESLFGGSKRAGCDCSLVKSTMGEPSRSRRGEGHTRRPCCGAGRRVLPGYGELHARKVDVGTWEARLSSPTSGEDRPYKPKAKGDGGQRESEGVVVAQIGVQNNAPGAKGPRFDRAGRGGKR
jgi:hypothetical protein